VTGLLVVGSAVLLLDQWIKYKVRVLRPLRTLSGIPCVHIRRVANVNPIYRNRYTRTALVVVWFLALTSAVILLRTGARFQARLAEIGLGLAFGGASGNLLDIIRHRSVVDFIDLRWWPVFNVADVAIVGGLLLAFCG
jgi:signal peptidase II